VSSAAAEFQKLLDHRGVVINSPLGLLARLGLARSLALQGDTVRARDAYARLLARCQNADADVPVPQQARAEQARLE
jgi:eukaryotic-like serine/threonine-protein kinase